MPRTSPRPASAGTNPPSPLIQAKIVARQFGQALAELEPILADEPGNTDALYMSAVCRRYLGEFGQALALLGKLKALTPENGRAHQEEGHTYRDMGHLEPALAAYIRACRFNPALVAGWRGQFQLLASRGRGAEAAQAKAQLDYLQGLPPPLLSVLDLIHQGKLPRAEELCRKFMRKVPRHVEGMRLLADIGARFGVLADAEFLLESAHEIEPRNVRVHIDYIQILRKRQKFASALEQARRLLETDPEHPQFLSICAIETMQTGDYETALALFDKVLERIPGDPATLTSKGHAHKTRGEYDRSVAAYRAALAGQPRHGEAWYALANLKVYAFSDSELETMRGLAGGGELPHGDRVHLHFALGKALEDRKDFAASFDHYARGNRLKKALSSYDAGKMTEELRAQRRVCTPETARPGRTGGPSGARSDFRGWPAQGGLDTARTDLVVALPGGRHPGTAQHPLAVPAVAAARAAKETGRAIPIFWRSCPPGNSANSAGGTLTRPGFTAGRRRFSSTRCPTTSAMSA